LRNKLRAELVDERLAFEFLSDSHLA
jgi:hypothetical protein